MNKEDIIYDKLQNFHEGTGLTISELAKILDASRTTLQTVQQKVPNAGVNSGILHKLETFEMFPEVAIFNINQKLFGLSIATRNKAIAYLER